MVLDDKSDFAGFPHTVIDFETCCGGLTLGLEEGGHAIGFAPDAFGVADVRLSSDLYVGVANPARGGQLDAALAAVGSPPNLMFVSGLIGQAEPAHVQLDFEPPVNAVGLAVINDRGAGSVVMQAYNSLGAMIGSLEFDDPVIDGTVPGAPFGNAFDLGFGFMGILLPNNEISRVVISEYATAFDDLYFGVVPEPSTWILGALALSVLGRRGAQRKCPLRILGSAMFVSTLATHSAIGDVHGRVEAWVTNVESDLCGITSQQECSPPFGEVVGASDVDVCVEGGACANSGPGGVVTISHQGSAAVMVQADLDGLWVRVITTEIDDQGNLIEHVAPPIQQLVDDPVNGSFTLRFNAGADPSNELETARANALYYGTLAHGFLRDRNDTLYSIDRKVTIAVHEGNPSIVVLDVVNGYILLNRSGVLWTQEGIPLPNSANAMTILSVYGQTVFGALGLPWDADDPFVWGYGDAFAILAADHANVNWPHYARDYRFPESGGSALRKNFDVQCTDDAFECGRALAGLWWDINLQLRPSLGDAEALEVTRTLFARWTGIMQGAMDPRVLADELLEADDGRYGDGILENGSPHLRAICEAFILHTGGSNSDFRCPYDCDRDGVPDADEIAQCCTVGSCPGGCIDLNDNGVPDTCDNIRYVDPNAPGVVGQSQDGSSWRKAYRDLSDALCAINCDCCEGFDVCPRFGEIWVATGTYVPRTDCTTPDARVRTFKLPRAVRIYGGFAGYWRPGGGETRLSQRDPAANMTVLTGDLAGDDGGCAAPPCNAENTYHVVDATYASSTSILDGFTITGGNANGGGWYQDSGGGVFGFGGAPQIRSCTFDDNVGVYGGGIFSESGFVRMTDCVFDGNAADHGGGAFFRRGWPKLNNCTFSSNQATLGGGLRMEDGTLSCAQCVFSGNTALTGSGGAVFQIRSTANYADSVFDGNQGGEGGAILTYESGLSLARCTLTDNGTIWGYGGALLVRSGSTTIVNALVAGNQAQNSGGAIYSEDGGLLLVNCTIADNQAAATGGGLYGDRDARFHPKNTIFWNNAPNDYDWDRNEPQLSSCLVGVAPDFVGGGDYRLSENSPGIDAGDNNFTTEAGSADLAGSARLVEGDCDSTATIDVGAYERPCCICTPAPAPAPESYRKNRYISFAPDTPPPAAYEVRKQGAAGWTAWVGAPDAGGVAAVVSNPVYRTWTESVVHVGDCEIVPDAIYEILSTRNGIAFSGPLTVETAHRPSEPQLWGDTVGAFANGAWGPPNGVMNVSDIQAALQRFENQASPPPLTAVDVGGSGLAGATACLNQIVNFHDIRLLILAFQGSPYPFLMDPPCCPLCPSATLPPGCGGFQMGGAGLDGMAGAEGLGGDEPMGPDSGGVAITVDAQPYQIQAEQTATVEAFVGHVADLGAYETALTLTPAAGTVGTLTVETLTVESTRADFVFGAHSTLNGANVTDGKAGAALVSGSGIPVTGPAYLATYTYRASTGAAGVWEVTASDEAYLLDGAAARVESFAGNVGYVRVGVECTLDGHCDDGNQCTSDACVSGTCAHTNLPNGTLCDDGLFCTKTDKCNGSGLCVGGYKTPCTGTDHCCENEDACNPEELPCELE
ncbi:MAG: hypothetical protein HY763_02250 [Planctomycetes bacterium]|nr:hypothetical protein [Planctomycetota bacterium]